MSDPDLSKLRIDRGAPITRGSGGPRRRMTRWAIIAAIVAVLGYVGYLNGPAVQVETATVAQVYPSQAASALNSTGYVVAQRKAAVASKATGRLEWLGVREGSAVKAGEIIARLENRDVAAQVEQAAANVRVAEANIAQGQAEFQDAERALKRSAELLAKNFVSPAAHDSVVARHAKAAAAQSGYRAALSAAHANHRAAQVGFEQTLIRAPFDGIVLTKNANVGDVITPFSSALGSQAAVVTMADMTTLEVEADVAEANVGKVKVGQPCEIQLDALPGERFRGAVERTVPTVDRAKATVAVKIRFIDTDPRVLPDMSAKVTFLAREMSTAEAAPRTAVPASTIVERDRRKVVFAVREGKAVEVPVRTGAAMGDMIEVDGVKTGEKIVMKPGERMRSGTSVTAASK